MRNIAFGCQHKQNQCIHLLYFEIRRYAMNILRLNILYSFESFTSPQQIFPQKMSITGEQ